MTSSTAQVYRTLFALPLLASVSASDIVFFFVIVVLTMEMFDPVTCRECPVEQTERFLLASGRLELQQRVELPSCCESV